MNGYISLKDDVAKELIPATIAPLTKSAQIDGIYEYLKQLYKLNKPVYLDFRGEYFSPILVNIGVDLDTIETGEEKIILSARNQIAVASEAITVKLLCHVEYEQPNTLNIISLMEA